MKYNRITSIAVLTLTFLIYSVPSFSADKRSLTLINGDLYRFQNNFHFSVVLVTDAGVIVTDPINKNAAQWLKDEIASRFDKPIKYLVYSHDHVDHIAGGEVFEVANVVAHENARADIIGEKRATAVPNITFSDNMTITLGGKTVELKYLGRSHSDNMIVMNFPQQRVLFAVDFIPIKSLPWETLSDSYIPEWIDAVKSVEAMDFDILMPGHGSPGSKADVTALREYMEELYAAVLSGMREGQTLQQLQENINLPEYAGWGNYDKHLTLNIEGMYNQISLHRR
jgi:glyoxylase-like metal-dependent hydrolase (beta-lactamase superfamily II)